MPYATKSQIERARQPDLLTFLRRYKPDELIPTGPNAYKLRSHDSLKISNGKWCWWSHDKMGGVNALEYLIKVENMTPCSSSMSSAAFLLPTKNDPCPYLKLNGPRRNFFCR